MGSSGKGVNAGGGGGGVVQIVAEEADIEGSTIRVEAGSSNGIVGSAAVGRFFILGNYTVTFSYLPFRSRRSSVG